MLLLAEQCNPEWTSVPLVSWYYYTALKKRADVHLVCQVRNKAALIRAGLQPDRDFTAIDSERVAAPMYRLASLIRGGKGKGWTTNMAMSIPSYYYFERLVWKLLGPAIRQGDFDVVHRLTPLSPALPSTLARRCRQAGVPFVVGPMNGGLPWPKGFGAVQAREKEWLSSVRSLGRYLPHWRSTYRNATCVISGSRTTWNELAGLAGERHVYMHRNGVDVSRFAMTSRPGVENPNRPLELAFVGRLAPLKGCDMLLEAAAPFLRDGRIHLKMLGNGPDGDRLRALCHDLEIASSVEFLGQVPHADVAQHLSSADLFAFPSVREFGGAVVLEALACGVPVMVIDYGGPGELASKECGILIRLGSRSEIVRDLTNGIQRFVDDRSLLARFGEAGRRRVEQLFDWDVKARQLMSVYSWAVGLGERPSFESASRTARLAASCQT